MVTTSSSHTDIKEKNSIVVDKNETEDMLHIKRFCQSMERTFGVHIESRLLSTLTGKQNEQFYILICKAHFVNSAKNVMAIY